MTIRMHTCFHAKMSDETKIKMLAKLRKMSADRKTNDRKHANTMKICETNIKTLHMQMSAAMIVEFDDFALEILMQGERTNPNACLQ